MNPRDFPVRFSNLKEMRRSPAHYRHALLSGRKDSAAMRLGRMVHYGVLGGMPDDEEGQVRVYEGERRGNAWKDFEAKYPGDELVTRTEFERAQPIIEAVLNDPIAKTYLSGEYERKIVWDIGGRKCSSRLDVYNPGHFVADLKTTTHSGPHELMRQAWKMQYHAQLAFYQAAASAAGEPCPNAFIIGVEVNPPHVVTVLKLTPSVLEYGVASYRGWFETLRVCEDSDFWPGYVQQPVSWDVPEYIESSTDDEDEAAA